jgi:tRNA A-37 threonylcarbamoyl transferase component Bud32
MDLYEAHCARDRVFYDAPGTAETGGYLADLPPVPAGWRLLHRDGWVVLHPADDLPAQGWKVHVSATVDNAPRVLRATWEHCVAHRRSFKFLRDPSVLLAQNAKYADRSGSGKFIAIYPRDEAELADTLDELGTTLDGEHGPYILSDLRWRDGPLYVRYGGFAERWCIGEDGQPAMAIEDDTGRLVPDVRVPAFRPPPWVTLPAPLQRQLADLTLDDQRVPFEVQRVLHFSNAGGVYLADDLRHGTVVVKEARPHAGLDQDARDAVHRLRRERWALQHLAGLACVPGFLDHHRVWDHEFLVQEYVEGETLHQHVLEHHPFLDPAPTPEAVADYTEWALTVLGHVAAGLDSLHARGVIFGDLQPRNVVARPDGTVVFVDFELASTVDAFERPALGVPGYAAPPDRQGPAIDRYALGCLRIGLFLPLTEVIGWHADKVEELLDEIERSFPVPASFRDEVLGDLGIGRSTGRRSWRGSCWLPGEPPDWPALRESLVAAIDASATPERPDRLFPGDPAQFQPGGGVNLANGAAGVLWARHAAGVPRNPEHERWLLAALDRQPAMGPGLYDGWCGIALALDTLGEHGAGRDALARGAGRPLARSDDHSAFSGASGIALTLLHFGAGDEALRIAERLTTDLERDPIGRSRPGLLHGWTGPALLFIRLFEATADERWLDRAERALRRDLAGCTWTDETLQSQDDGRVLPYLGIGSAGVGIVLAELLDHRPSEPLAADLAGIRRAAVGRLVIQSGLFNGRAGLLLSLHHRRRGEQPALARHVADLGWHAVPYRGHVAFVGDQLMRLSMDLATGSAGVLLALAAVIGDRPAGLPFLTAHPTTPQEGGE